MNDEMPFRKPIRYRVWDGETMHEPIADDYNEFAVGLNGSIYKWSPVTLEFEPCPDAVALLSTGLTDAEGREVFEGDVFFDEWGNDDIVIGWNDERAAWWLYYGDGRTWGVLWQLFVTGSKQSGVVIGHVYEPRFAHLREHEAA